MSAKHCLIGSLAVASACSVAHGDRFAVNQLTGDKFPATIVGEELSYSVYIFRREKCNLLDVGCRDGTYLKTRRAKDLRVTSSDTAVDIGEIEPNDTIGPQDRVSVRTVHTGTAQVVFSTTDVENATQEVRIEIVDPDRAEIQDCSGPLSLMPAGPTNLPLFPPNLELFAGSNPLYSATDSKLLLDNEVLISPLEELLAGPHTFSSSRFPFFEQQIVAYETSDIDGFDVIPSTGTENTGFTLIAKVGSAQTCTLPQDFKATIRPIDPEPCVLENEGEFTTQANNSLKVLYTRASGPCEFSIEAPGTAAPPVVLRP